MLFYSLHSFSTHFLTSAAWLDLGAGQRPDQANTTAKAKSGRELHKIFIFIKIKPLCLMHEGGTGSFIKNFGEVFINTLKHTDKQLHNNHIP